eukprot:2184395-Prymnesium_polylepis.3
MQQFCGRPNHVAFEVRVLRVPSAVCAPSRFSGGRDATRGQCWGARACVASPATHAPDSPGTRRAAAQGA